MGTFSRERNKPAPDWPNLQNNLTEGRFCFDNLDLVKPNPDGCTNNGRIKAKGRVKAAVTSAAHRTISLICSGSFGYRRVHCLQTRTETPNQVTGDTSITSGKTHTNNNPNGKINCWRGPKKQNDFFQILHYALNRLACSGGQQPGNLARTFAIGASLIDQYDSDADDLDLHADRYQQEMADSHDRDRVCYKYFRLWHGNRAM